MQNGHCGALPGRLLVDAIIGEERRSEQGQNVARVVPLAV